MQTRDLPDLLDLSYRDDGPDTRDYPVGMMDTALERSLVPKTFVAVQV